MGRQVQIRSSYQNDARFLMRLTEALEKDKKRTFEWRRKITGLLREATTMLINANAGEDSANGG